VARSDPSSLLPSWEKVPDRADEGAVANQANRARALRRNSTEVEKRLWGLLRDRRFVGYKFRRQVPVGRWITDFLCYEGKLIVELDGSQHFENARDIRRDAELEERGFEVVRVWNSELNSNPDGVLELILARLTVRSGAPSSALRAPSPTRGEGDGAEGVVR
jgi:very-short-patch-repair endonuclease